MNARKLMSSVLLVVLTSCLSCTQAPPPPKVKMTPKDHVLGVGATFPEPLYSQWIKDYMAANPGSSVRIPVGSSEGVKSFLEREPDFGASDAAMTDEEIAQVEQGVQLIPTTAVSSWRTICLISRSP